MSGKKSVGDWSWLGDMKKYALMKLTFNYIEMCSDL